MINFLVDCSLKMKLKSLLKKSGFENYGLYILDTKVFAISRNFGVITNLRYETNFIHFNTGTVFGRKVFVATIIDGELFVREYDVVEDNIRSGSGYGFAMNKSPWE